MNLFYAPNIEIEEKNYVFDKAESGHISRVLRKNRGDKLFITNGKGYLFEAIIIDDNPNKTRVNLASKTFKEKQQPKIHIAIAPTKSNERFEWFLEKATEIGVDEITPILTEHSERKKINLDRFERVVISAMKQSLQYHKPKINPLTKLSDLLKKIEEEQKLIAYCKAKNNILISIDKQKDKILLIGPEGGFSMQEFNNVFENDFIPVSLSNKRLRTETAGVVAVTALRL